MEKIIGICSGGLDSVSAISQYEGSDVLLMTFDYGQKAKKEMDIVEELAKKIGAEIKTIDISFMKDLFGDNQLTNDAIEVKDSYQPSVIVPLRNSVFIQIAMVYAYAHGYDKVVLGSHTGDVSLTDKGDRAYPDCSPEYFKAMELAMDLGTKTSEKRVKIVAPSLMSQDKTDLIEIGFKHLGDFIFKTWSCYKNGVKQCGKCESCMNRKRAFEIAGIEDKTEYENDEGFN